jgi:BON domain
MRRMSRSLWIPAMTLLLIMGCAKKANDTQLANNIKAQLFSDPQTKDAGVQVAVKDGVATLTGTAPSDAAHLEAYKIATNTPGVSKVDDQIAVQAPQQTADATPPAESQPPAPAPEPKPEKKAARRVHHAVKHSEPKPAEAPADSYDADSAPPTASTPPAASTPPPTPAEAQPAAPAPPPPPQSINVEIPSGAPVEVQTIDAIDSSTAQVGQEFQASLAQPIVSDGRVIVPAGGNVYIKVVSAASAGHYKGQDVLELQLSRMDFQGQRIALTTTTYELKGGSRGQNTAEKIGGGAALGAIIGAIAGGGKGAAIGAGVGGAGGTVYQGATKPKPIRVAPETIINFKLTQPVDLTYTPPSDSQ